MTRQVDIRNKVCIIAEAGVNHNGSMDLALGLVDAAARAGADYVKFQSFRAEALASSHAHKADYQRQTTDAGESHLDMLRKLELGVDQTRALMERCAGQSIGFMSSPFDLQSLALLLELGVDALKIPSGEVTNLPYLRRLGQGNKPVILSTGMATLEEVQAAVDVLETAGAKRGDLSILHCNTQYPTPFEDVNLRVMRTLEQAFPGARIGYSDHTLGIEVPVAAVALGAQVIEKHFTLDRALPGPDHAASLEPVELGAMVASVRNVELALGSPFKTPTASETPNMAVARKSIVAAKHIRKGDLLTEDNLTTKRPGTGISPMRWDEIVGTTALRDYEPDELI